MFILATTFLLLGLLTLAELFYGDHLSSGRLINLSVAFVSKLSGMALLPLVALYVPHSLIDGRALPFAVDLALFVVAVDLGEYAFHRAQHAIPWLWKLHALHHSDPDMNSTTAGRHFWGDKLMKSVTIWPAAALIVSPSPSVALSYTFLTLWNYVAHSRLPVSFGALSWLLISPAYHRRHHSILPEHHDSNFSALLPIWDVLLGSYNRPEGGVLPTGLSSGPPTAVQTLSWPMSVDWPLQRRSVVRPTD